MTDESPTSRAELASADLDDEVTSDERAIVAGAPDLVAEREAYAALRDRLADVAVPSAARDQAIFAALAVFDELGADEARSDSPAAAPVVSIGAARGSNRPSRRARSYRWLGGVAAAAVIGVVAVAAIGTRNDSDNKNVASDTNASRTELAPLPKAGATTPPAAGGAAAGNAPAADQSAASDAPSVETAGSLEDDGGSTVTSAAAGTIAPSQYAGWPAQIQLSSPSDVAGFAAADDFGLTTLASTSASTSDAGTTDDTTAASTAESTATTAPPRPQTPTDSAVPATTTAPAPFASQLSSCFTSITLPYELAFYLGKPVIVVRDGVARLITVIDAVTCQATVTVALP